MPSETNRIFDQTPKRSINPYLTALSLVVNRLKWDLKPLSWQSRQKIKKWGNRYSGKKAIILCNGPSLTKVDFDYLRSKSVFTFGLNKINLLFGKTAFRPSVIVAVNPFVIEQNREFYNLTDIPVFLDSKGSKWVKNRNNIHFLHSCTYAYAGAFSRDCTISINQGYTVTYVAIQLAYHMGFSDVALVGCDHYFHTKGPANKKVAAEQEDPNHFDPRYFSNGVTWQLPDLLASEFHYQKARDIFTHFDRRIINCTDGGNLEIFNRLPLKTFLK